MDHLLLSFLQKIRFGTLQRVSALIQACTFTRLPSTKNINLQPCPCLLQLMQRAPRFLQPKNRLHSMNTRKRCCRSIEAFFISSTRFTLLRREDRWPVETRTKSPTARYMVKQHHQSHHHRPRPRCTAIVIITNILGIITGILTISGIGV